MISENINGVSVEIVKSENLFSPGALDLGTKAMLKTYPADGEAKILDLGCGAGWVGIYASKVIGNENVVLCDIDENAVAAAGINASHNAVSPKIVLSDGFSALDDTGFSLIYSNPPYQTDFKVAKHFIEKGFNRLALGGRMIMVTKRRAWYENKLKSIFGGCKVTEESGYFVFCAIKKSMSYAGKKK